jgi:hypothetical protein
VGHSVTQLHGDHADGEAQFGDLLEDLIHSRSAQDFLIEEPLSISPAADAPDRRKTVLDALHEELRVHDPIATPALLMEPLRHRSNSLRPAVYIGDQREPGRIRREPSHRIDPLLVIQSGEPLLSLRPTVEALGHENDLIELTLQPLERGQIQAEECVEGIGVARPVVIGFSSHAPRVAQKHDVRTGRRPSTQSFHRAESRAWPWVGGRKDLDNTTEHWSMGRPTHYSTEIVSRCQRLIERLSDQISSDSALVDEFGGPLRTTFLLAMSTPMIVLPMERLYKPLIGREGVADDTALNPNLSQRVLEQFDGHRAADAPFFVAGDWAYIDAVTGFEVAGLWPAEVFDMLADPAALAAAADAPLDRFLGCLRNALSHGGVTYLDRTGRQSHAATNMLGFASFPSLKRTGELRILRISVDGFERFLGLWTRWLTESGVEQEMSQDGPGWYGKPLAA